VVSDILIRQQEPDLARQVRGFADYMSPAMTEKEGIAAQLLERARENAERNRESRSQ
jgi:hypothetical protein